MGDACFPHYLGRRLLPDAYGYPVSRTASVDMCSEGMCFACCCLFVFSNFWGLATLTKLNTAMRICRTKFGIVTLIFDTEHIYCCALIFAEELKPLLCSLAFKNHA